MNFKKHWFAQNSAYNDARVLAVYFHWRTAFVRARSNPGRAGSRDFEQCHCRANVMSRPAEIMMILAAEDLQCLLTLTILHVFVGCTLATAATLMLLLLPFSNRVLDRLSVPEQESSVNFPDARAIILRLLRIKGLFEVLRRMDTLELAQYFQNPSLTHALAVWAVLWL